MSENHVPGPDDAYRGVVEIDFYECLPPEMKAKFRLGKFLPANQPPLGSDESPPPEPNSKDADKSAG